MTTPTTTPRRAKLKPESVREPLRPLAGDALQPLFDELVGRAVARQVLPAPARPWWQSKRLGSLGLALGVLVVKVIVPDRIDDPLVAAATGLVIAYIAAETVRPSGQAALTGAARRETRQR